jgi:hypothetical protein
VSSGQVLTQSRACGRRFGPSVTATKHVGLRRTLLSVLTVPERPQASFRPSDTAPVKPDTAPETDLPRLETCPVSSGHKFLTSSSAPQSVTQMKLR